MNKTERANARHAQNVRDDAWNDTIVDMTLTLLAILPMVALFAAQFYR